MNTSVIAEIEKVNDKETLSAILTILKARKKAKESELATLDAAISAAEKKAAEPEAPPLPA